MLVNDKEKDVGKKWKDMTWGIEVGGVVKKMCFLNEILFIWLYVEIKIKVSSSNT